MKGTQTYYSVTCKIEKLADLPFYTEGPVADDKGNIFFTTLSGKTVYKLDQKGSLHQWGYSPCPNGQVICNSGDHLICDPKLGAVRRFDADGNFRENIIFKSCGGRSVFSPNDLVLDKSEGFYFTDSIRKVGAVYYCTKEGSEFVVAQNLDYPNGLVLSQDEKTLFIAESYANRVLMVNLAEPGIPFGGPEVFAMLPGHSQNGYNLPDGIAINKKGNLFVAHYGMQAIQVISPAGNLLFSVDTGLPLTSNVFISDPGTLIVTGGYQEPGPGAVLRIQFSMDNELMEEAFL